MAQRSTKQSALTKKHVARLERERRLSLIIRWSAIVIVAFIVIGALVMAFIGGSLSIGKLNIDYIYRNRTVVKLGEDTANMHEFQNYVRLQRQQMLGQYVMYSQYAQFGLDVTQQLQQIQSQLDPTATQTIGQQVVDGLVNDLLIRQEAKKRGITVSDAEVQARIQGIFAYFPSGTSTPTVTPTEITFPTLSAEQLKLITLTSTPTATLDLTITSTPTLAPTATETSRATITLTPNLTTTATATVSPTATIPPTATETQTPTATITPTFTPAPTFTPQPTPTAITLQSYQDTFSKSLESYLKLGISKEDYTALVISDLLRTKLFNVMTADVKPFEEQVWARHILVADQATALVVREHLLRGEDFGALAAQYSTDTSNKDTGGDLGWFGKGQMAAEFETAAWALKIGEISQPVKTQFGYHIIQVIGHENRPLTADAFDQLKQTTFNDWLTAARKQAESAGLLTIFDIWKSHTPVTPGLSDLQAPPTP